MNVVEKVYSWGLLSPALKQKYNVRSKNFRFVLYPDNPHHINALGYIVNSSILKGWYIWHEPEADEKKKHCHVTVSYPNVRTLRSVCDSFGDIYYGVTDSGQILYDNFSNCEIIHTNLFNIPCPLVETCSSLSACAEYDLHRDFKSVMRGKKQYVESQVNSFGDIGYFQRCYALSDLEKKEIVNDLYKIACSSSSKQEFFETVLSLADSRYYEYVEKHSFFIDRFFF